MRIEWLPAATLAVALTACGGTAGDESSNAAGAEPPANPAAVSGGQPPDPADKFVKGNPNWRVWVVGDVIDPKTHPGDAPAPGDAFRLQRIGPDIYLKPVGPLATKWMTKYHKQQLPLTKETADLLCAEMDLEHGAPPGETELVAHIIRLQSDAPNRLILSYGDKSAGDTCVSNRVHGGSVHVYN